MTRNKQPKLTLVIDPQKIMEIKIQALKLNMTASEYIVMLHEQYVKEQS